MASTVTRWATVNIDYNHLLGDLLDCRESAVPLLPDSLEVGTGRRQPIGNRTKAHLASEARAGYESGRAQNPQVASDSLPRHREAIGQRRCREIALPQLLEDAPAGLVSQSRQYRPDGHAHAEPVR